jgi:hypothetical protein
MKTKNFLGIMLCLSLVTPLASFAELPSSVVVPDNTPPLPNIVQMDKNGNLPGQGDNPNGETAWQHRHNDNMKFWGHWGPIGILVDAGTTVLGLHKGIPEANIFLRWMGPYGIAAFKVGEFFYLHKKMAVDPDINIDGPAAWAPAVINGWNIFHVK